MHPVNETFVDAHRDVFIVQFFLELFPSEASRDATPSSIFKLLDFRNFGVGQLHNSIKDMVDGSRDVDWHCRMFRLRKMDENELIYGKRAEQEYTT
jgi:hypothetical protein